ncbi:MAG: DegT/DnrJ/EryC1/StrS family aminotransferase [Acetobacteraceae bacterium]|jgi:dTDP-4-amino-4,6-dideoxygalactose transaminase
MPLDLFTPPMIAAGKEFGMRRKKTIYVTRPHLPPLEEFVPYLEKIWESRELTNCGPFHQQLEKELCDYLGVEHIALFANATIALVTALQTLRITGEVITTPFSFVATSHSLLWNGLKPIFVDVQPDTLNINPKQIESAITPQTTAILAVHCYGHPCDVDAIQRIADTYNLKVIYDAAHAFGVKCHCGSILEHGDLSVLSFHATKVFNTFEGGAIICPDLKTKTHIDQLKNFGHFGETQVVATGINGKMSEFNAALGILQLKYVDEVIQRRKIIDKTYRKGLAGIKGVRCLGDAGEKVANYAYFPILIDHQYPISRDALYERMRAKGVHPRRYFYPLITEFPMYRGFPSSRRDNLPVASEAADQVLCLPIYPDLAIQIVHQICEFIAEQ